MKWPIIMFFLLLSGCSRQQHLSKHFVILVDTSASIDARAEEECAHSILKLVEKMDRGDQVTVIPITGDADVQSTGRVLRFQKPVSRTAYDGDLVLFSKQVQKSLADFQSWAISHPAGKTDIFGGIRIAAEEFTTMRDDNNRFLVIFSDFIEDDGIVDFKSDTRLLTSRTAAKYARQEARTAFVSGISAPVSMGLLRSKELGKLNKGR